MITIYTYTYMYKELMVHTYVHVYTCIGKQTLSVRVVRTEERREVLLTTSMQ